MGRSIQANRVLLIAGGLATVLFLALRAERGPNAREGREAGSSAALDASPAASNGLAGDAAPSEALVEAFPAREEVTAITSVPDGSATPSEAALGSLRVRVVAVESKAPLAGVRVAVFQPERGIPSLAVESTRGSLAQSPRTEAAGEVEFELPTGWELRLAASGEDGDAGRISLTLAPFAPGELRELRVELPTEPDLAFHGRVLDDANSLSIAGARLELREGIQAPVAAGESAADGYFRLQLGSWRHSLLAVSAPGYAPRELAVTSGHDPPAGGRAVRRAPTASLSVRLVEGTGAPVVGARVVLEPQADDSLFEGGSVFFPRRGGGRASSTSDGAGECRFEALPPDVLLRVEVQRDNHASVGNLPPITLHAGEERTLEWRLDTGALLTGFVVDPSGTPVPNGELWLLRASRAGSEFFDVAPGRDVRRARSDERGRFAFPDCPPGAWWLGPAATRGYSDPPDLAGLAPFAERVELASDERVREVRVVVQRGLFVRGRVLDADDAPASDVFVYGSLVGDPRASLTVETGDDGFFVLGPLVPGRYALVAQSPGAGESAPVEVEAGGDVLLRLLRGGELSGSVLEGITGHGVVAWVRAARGSTGISCMVNSQEDGSFSLRGLTPGTYDVCARAGGGLVGSLRVELGAGEERAITLRLARGATLRLRAAEDGGKRSYRVLQDGLELEAVELEPGGVTEVVVPAGTIVVRGADASAGEREVVLAAGEFRELALGGL